MEENELLFESGFLKLKVAALLACHQTLIKIHLKNNDDTVILLLFYFYLM